MSFVYAAGIFLSFGVVSAFLTWLLIKHDNEVYRDTRRQEEDK